MYRLRARTVSSLALHLLRHQVVSLVLDPS